MTAANDAWNAIKKTPKTSLSELFTAEPDRLSRLSIDESGMLFDFSKTHLSTGLIGHFEALAAASGFTAKRDALFAGEAVNVTEGRAAEHPAERGQGSPDSVDRARGFQSRMRAMVDAIEAEVLGPVRHILHVGIGGSALGPDLLVDALGRDADRYEVAVVSNVDGAALDAVFKRFDPQATLLVVASKTFTTTETMMNARSVLGWMEEDNVEDP